MNVHVLGIVLEKCCRRAEGIDEAGAVGEGFRVFCRLRHSPLR